MFKDLKIFIQTTMSWIRNHPYYTGGIGLLAIIAVAIFWPVIVAIGVTINILFWPAVCVVVFMIVCTNRSKYDENFD
jgi:hypothetical protein